MLKKDGIAQLAARVTSGDRVALAQAITLVESTKSEHLDRAEELLSLCRPHVVESRRIGITGIPGVGKSTFIESFGCLAIEEGHRVAVLAVDPSSGTSRGSILGDKTRMERLSSSDKAFIRPTAAAGSLGGVARKTRETITLCEAAGFDTILVETVGVGQSEITVHSMVDMFLLLVLATAGDELQGIKRGIMEMADAIIINKDDGNQRELTAKAKASYHQALHMFPPKDNGWTVPVVSCSSLESTGLDKVNEKITAFFQHVRLNGQLERNRSEQDREWLHNAIKDALVQNFLSDPSIKNELLKLEAALDKGHVSPFSAARELLRKWGQSN